MLLLDRESCYEVVGETIQFTTDVTKSVEVVVALFGTFYLLDFYYQRHN